MYQVIKLTTYIICIMISMYSLSSIRFDDLIRKGQERLFYVLFIIVSLVLGYNLAQFIFDFTTIHF
ncbi:MAG: DUF1146 domain-containing protein [Erysipelotrichaceae bacterium]|nr:DUF1146 domain-containing protein [Erysipelotrichaceae bacterium]MDD3809662.1 DUF1146 domain-containing protein [Erysipelotrichaceae bacterium]